MVHKIQDQIASTIPVSRIRCVASQVIACMPPNFLLLDLGMAISFATIAVPSLLNAKEGLSLDETQASWFGSLSYLTQPVGALLSGPVVDFCGRKRANFLVNIPHLVAWLLLYFSWDLPSLFIANGLLGLGTGIMEAPINSYVGEISEPSVRGALCTLTQLFTSIGVFVMYFLGTVVDWRRAALISLVVPVSSMAFVFLVPETPVWLLSRGREKDALKSLCYLRGWTKPEDVKEEFDELVEYSKKLQKCVICDKIDDVTKSCEHYKMNSFKRSIYKFRYVMLGKETMRPLVLVMMYFLFYVMSGLAPIRPNMVNICGALGMAQDGKVVVLMVGVITFLTALVVVMLIKVVGKRKLAISAMFGTAIFCAALSVYSRKNLADSVYSYDTNTFPTEKSYVPLVLFYMVATFTGLAVPWVLLGEVFPFRSRASAQGIAAASNYIFSFLAAKTFIDLEINLKLWGTFATYSGFGFLGTIYLYFYLPETEGKTLQEIEDFYNEDKSKTFADDPFINFFKRFKRKKYSM
ncbi:PREDICTED: facilitated trehalose transporter Tret1-like isoform X1 [Papilio polytes]|uniref:facilitated trehalose transporter Tret1-like isoform X1 n=1 Tax=Papilio polytes TaxID=76194 RepID=UPI0006765038|nr:PREDICTED: facilitated trehalose transporter Tret1-like isoform X1 [Papilio polytes]